MGKRSARQRLIYSIEWAKEQNRRVTIPFLILCLYGLSIGINMYRYTRGKYALYPVFAGKVLLVAKCFVGIAEVSFGLLLVPVSRGFVTWLRSTWLRHVIDFDTALDLHAWLAVIGIVAGTVHGTCATIAYSNVGKIPAEIQLAVGKNPKDLAGMLLSWNILSGWGLFALAAITFPFALKWPRQAPWLKDTKLGKLLNSKDCFWITHHILIIVFIPVAIMHSIKWTPGFPLDHLPAEQLKSTKFWYYMAVPLIIYLFNRLQQIATASHLALVVDAHVVGGDVLALKVLKPRFFNYKPGQYLFVCCPKISQYEWHPFTITSAPQDGYLSMHIKRAGDWTGALHDLFTPVTLGDSGQLQVGGHQQLLLKPAAAESEQACSHCNTALTVNNADLSGAARKDSTGDSIKRQISVDICARLTEDACFVPPLSRRTSAIGSAAADATTDTQGVNSGGSFGKGANLAKVLSSNARRLNSLLAGAWDPRAERVIDEAGERLKEAAVELAGEQQLANNSKSNATAQDQALATFTGYGNRRCSITGMICNPAAAAAVWSAAPGAVNSDMALHNPETNLATAAEINKKENVFVPPLLYIDGPFGAPTQDFEHYKVVMLVGTGIGITPMASVLRSLMHDLYDARCENCGEINRRLCRMRQTKVYVHWVTRSLEGMAWFQDLLTSISMLDVDRVFQFNVHITRETINSASGGTFKPAAGNQIMPSDSAPSSPFQSSSGAAGRPSGVKLAPEPVKIEYKRPNMYKALESVQKAHRNEYVGVFFCGPRVMGQQVKKACRALNAAARVADAEAEGDTEAADGPRAGRLCFHEEIF